MSKVECMLFFSQSRCGQLVSVVINKSPKFMDDKCTDGQHKGNNKDF